MRKLDRLVIMAILVFGLAEFALPGVASRIAADRAAEIAREATGMVFWPVRSAAVRSFPAASMLLGLVDRIVVDFGPVKVGSVSIDTVRMDVSDLRFAPLSLVAAGGLCVIDQGQTTVEMQLSEESINRDLAALGLPLALPRITLEHGRVKVGGQAQIGSLTCDVEFHGRLALEPSEPGKALFLPGELDINGQAAPPLLNTALRALLGDSVTLVDLRGQGIPLALTQIEVLKGQVRILATRSK